VAWIKIDDQFVDHPKVVRAGPEAAWLYVCGLAYCARFLTDGAIPEPAIRSFADFADTNPSDLADRLVDVGLWARLEDGYQVHDYLDYQRSKSQIEHDRAMTAQRQGRHRSNVVSNGDSNGVSTAAPIPIPIPIPKEEKKERPSVSPKKGVPEVSEGYRSKKVKEFKELFGGVAAVEEEIDRALNHTAALKWLNTERGVSGWLGRERDRRLANGTRPVDVGGPSRDRGEGEWGERADDLAARQREVDAERIAAGKPPLYGV